jgi:hypothetical protein
LLLQKKERLVGTAKRGKGTMIMAVAYRSGPPIANHILPATKYVVEMTSRKSSVFCGIIGWPNLFLV